MTGFFNKLPVKHTYLSMGKAVCYSEEKFRVYSPEFLISLTSSGMPPYRLILESGAVTMRLCNLDITRGLCYGTHLIVMQLHKYVIDAGKLTGGPVLLQRI